MDKAQQTRLNPLTESQIEAFTNNGYLIIKNSVSTDLIDAYNRHIHDLRALAADEMPEWVKEGMKHNQADSFDKSRFTTRVFNPHKSDSFSLQMMKLPIIRGALAQLLGDEAVGIQTMYFFKEPGSLGQAPHQDYNYIHNEPNTLIGVWMAMEDTDVENGCLWVVPGSHRLGLLKHSDVRNLKEYDPLMSEAQNVDLTQEIPVELSKGDFIVFHNLLVHSSLRNKSADRWRRSNVIHYIRHDSEVTRRAELKQKISLL
ncbi:phytanoyl-CoA dioxygenase family protein [Paenibacillus lycopersici]|uniref:Phytanoyl-CoA dioxygenase family protein n=1 Tax=Paenibacillus lycopersici TaxID=2704462 RepID=A0A6C0G709_9BACL|nr:phytanoyl-CoA dioxygenase family protein [Paenibacillus lycopersici]QHT62495.1 phytanoyl-CoA dioxygenase family protein [Paenibacillus lycopersici]